MSKPIIKLRYKIKNNDSNFISKYQPRTLSDLMLTTEQMSKLVKWFEEIKTSNNQGLFLVGPPGCGKTCVVNTFCNHYGYKVKEFNAFDCRNKKIVDTVILKMIEHKPIDSLLYNGNQYAIVIDELECMADKNSLNTIIKLINKKKKSPTDVNIPLIFISNDTTEKKINELKKHCTEVKFVRPSRENLLTLYKKVLMREDSCTASSLEFPEGVNGVLYPELAILTKIDGKTFDQEGKTIVSNKLCQSLDEPFEMIVNAADGDYRRLLNLLEFIIGQKKIGKDDGPLKIDLVRTCVILFQEKYQDHDIYQNCVRLFNSSSINESIRIYENDKSLLPMMVHENYCYLIGQRYRKKKEQLKASLSVINNITTGDLIDKIMYNTQSWHYSTIHSLMSCYIPAYTSWNLSKRPDIKFTTTLGKHSLQSSNKKKFLCVLSNIGNGKTYSTKDLYYLGNIIRYHAVNPAGDIEIVKRIMKTYSLNFDMIDRIIRFSKLGEDVVYGAKLKNILKVQLQGVKLPRGGGDRHPPLDPPSE